MSDKEDAMRVNVTLSEEDTDALVRVMAAMPQPRTSHGVPVAITPADVLRYALRKTAGRR